jgi:hypothetical protein
MAFNGSGVFVRLYNWVQDAANSIPITASRMDAETQGIADGLTNCITKDGQSLPSADITLNNHKLTNVSNPTASGDAVNKGYADGTYASIAAVPVVLDTFASLGAALATVNQVVTIRGHTTFGIGGGQFIAKSGSVTSDGGTQTNSATVGLYWQRQDSLDDEWNAHWFNCYGDALTDVSAAFIKAKDAAKNANKSLFFPAGDYITSGVTDTGSGRLMWRGENNQTSIVGGIDITKDFPTSADTGTPPTQSSILISFRELNFRNETGYGLTATANNLVGFESAMDLKDCTFYGKHGMLTTRLLGCTWIGLKFHTRGDGIRANSCTNITYIGCLFHNQAAYGLYLGDDGDGASPYYGGELHKLVGCEFAVCTTGIYADRVVFLELDDVLIDYCSCPFFMRGCRRFNITNSYFGPSQVANGTHHLKSEYVAPPADYIALYSTTFGGFEMSGTVSHCWMIKYDLAGGTPLVYFDSLGQANGVAYLQFDNNTVNAYQDHTMPTLLKVTEGRNIKVLENQFEALTNSTSTMQKAYDLVNCEVAGTYCVGNNIIDVKQGAGIAPAPPEEEDGFYAGIRNNRKLRAKLAAGTVVNLLSVNTSDQLELYIPTNTSKLIIKDQSGTQLFGFSYQHTDLTVQGLVNKRVNVGAANSGGAGQRLLTIDN